MKKAKAGTVTTGRIELGNGATIMAGIDGSGIAETDIRIWAGSTYANRASAPFKVLQNGKAYMTSAEIQNGCKVGNWTISANGLINDDDTAYIIARNLIDATHSIEARIGANVFPSSSGLSCPAYFANTESNSLGTNLASYFVAENANNNIAAYMKGNAVVRGAVLDHAYNLMDVSSAYSVNVIAFKNGTNVRLYNSSAIVRAVYLPTLSDIQADLQLTTGVAFMLNLKIFAHYALGANCTLYSNGVNFYNQNGSAATSLAMGSGDSVDLMCVYTGSLLYWQILNVYS